MHNLAFDKIVNKQNKLPSDYVPDDLVNTDENEDNFHQYMNPLLKPQISASILPFFKEMQKSAEKEELYIIIDKGKEEITGFNYEPWHYRFVGKELAKYLSENHLTMEEYKKHQIDEFT